MTRHDIGAIRLGMSLAALLVPLLAQPAAGQPAAGQPAARPPADAARSVTLPLAEYNRLLDLASRPPAAPPAAPVAATLAAADIRVRADESAVRGTIAIQGDVLRNGNQRVPLVTGATLLDASTAAGPLPLVAEGAVHSAVLPGPGPFAVTLEWGAPLTFTPGRASFTLPVPAAGAARATFDLPGEGADVRISSGVVTGRTAAAGRTIVEAALEPGSSPEVSWSMRDRAAAADSPRETRAVADVFTLLTIGESDVRMVALVELGVVLGEPARVDLQLPAGYELVSLHGTSFDTYTERDRLVTLSLADPAARRHQFLVRLERPRDPAAVPFETGLLTMPSAQREQGEVAIAGTATIDLRTADREGLRRVDVRELHPSLQALAGGPMLSGFRYHTSAGSPPTLALEVRQFDDVGVLAAVADRATATTLVSADGRSLTEVVLQVRNRAQPYLKVSLPPGASIVSVEVAGQLAKPALGADGTRVPLLRPGFRPEGRYQVSFVYLHDGDPFDRRGDRRMALPRLDIPIGFVEWEVFVPDRYRARVAGGNVIARTAFRGLADLKAGPGRTSQIRVSGGAVDVALDPRLGTVTGLVRDTVGAALPGVTVELTSPVLTEKVRRAVTDQAGAFRVASLPPGVYMLTLTLEGFVTARHENVLLTGGTVTTVTSALSLAGVVETVTVVGEAPIVDGQSVTRRIVIQGDTVRDLAPRPPSPEDLAAIPSQNVVDLQTRAAGVLPVRVDVPRAGTAHKFVRPLVVNDETVVMLRYRRR